LSPDPAAISPVVFRRVMGRFATGVTVVTAVHGNEVRGMTANAFMSGSIDPPLLVVSIAHRASMHAHLLRAGAFGVSVLAIGQSNIAAHFGGKRIDGFSVDFAFVDGIPTVPESVATMTATVTATYPCGDHTLVVGRILGMSATEDRAPLIFHAGRYGRLVASDGAPPVPDLL
jgi:flavin reductase (DIM6/NTAB) family NADH-FMN oxidoreductase RutF